MSLFGHHVHHCDNPLEGASPLEVENHFILVHILVQLEKIMTVLDDTKAALADLATAVGDGIAELEVLIAKATTPGTSDADLSALKDQMTTLAGSIRAEVQKAKDAVPQS